MSTPTNESQQLGNTLKTALQQQDMTAAELAEKSGVSLATLSRILSGQVNPSISNMVKIAQVLEISLDALTGLTTNGPAAVTTSTKETESQATQSNSDLTDVLATYVLPDTDRSPAEAAQLLKNAAHGAWIEAWTEQFVDKAKTPRPIAVDSRQTGNRRVEVDLAFPHGMVEDGSLVGLLAVLGSAATSTDAKLVDIRIPDLLLRTFPGPAFGSNGLRDFTGKFGRPLLSVTMRPMMGLSPRMYGRAAFETLKGGVDITADPTLLHSIPSNQWRERFQYLADAVHSAQADTNEFKCHAANVTAPTIEGMLQRAELVKQLGLNMILVDSSVIGWIALQSLATWCRQNDMILCAMGSRTLSGDILTEQVQAKLLRLAGADVVSTASPLRGGTSGRRAVRGVTSALTQQHIEVEMETGLRYAQSFANHATSLPAVGGGHNPWHFPRLVDALGPDLIIQCGGSVMGHPWGSAAGATANRTAIEAVMQARGEGRNLTVESKQILTHAQKYAPELKVALEYWAEESFLFGVILGDQKDGVSGTVVQEKAAKKPKTKTTLRSIDGDRDK